MGQRVPWPQCLKRSAFGGEMRVLTVNQLQKHQRFQVLDKWTPLRASRTSTNRNTNLTLHHQLHTNKGRKNTTANVGSLLFFQARDKYLGINSCNKPVSRYWVIIPILQTK